MCFLDKDFVHHKDIFRYSEHCGHSKYCCDMCKSRDGDGPRRMYICRDIPMRICDLLLHSNKVIQLTNRRMNIKVKNARNKLYLGLKKMYSENSRQDAQGQRYSSRQKGS